MGTSHVRFRVATTSQWDQNLLTGAQCDLLPADAPCDPLAGHWFIGYDTAANDHMVAFACLKVTAHEGYGYLARAGVYKSNRGEGLQVRMIRLRERLARKLGLKIMVCDTHKHNVHSSNSLIRCGYRLYTPAEPWGLEDSLYWIKKL